MASRQRHLFVSPPFALRACAHAGFFSLGLLAAWPVLAEQIAQAPAAVRRVADIPAGPLGRALSLYATRAGVVLSFDSALAEGLSTRGLKGEYTIKEGFDALLAGSALEVVRAGDGGYLMRKAAALPPASSAAPSGGEQTLPTVVVRAATERERANGPVDGYVARRSATGTKTDTSILEIPQSISIIGRTEMEARGAQDMMDIVANTPGVSINGYGPDNRGWEYINLRGFFSDTGNFRDGLPQGRFDVAYRMTEPYGLERVEVLRGPAAVLFGQGDVGGVINRVSKMPTGEALREIELQYGSFQRKQAAFDIADRFGESDLSFRLIGVGLDSYDQDKYPDGHRINRKRLAISPSLRWQPDAATSFTLLTEFLRDRSGEDPYYAIAGNGSLTRVKMGDYSFTKFEHEQASVGYKFEHAFNDTWSLRQNARYVDLSLDRNALWVDSLQADGHTYSRVARRWKHRVRQGAIDTHLQGRLQTGAIGHTVLIGMDWNSQEGDAVRKRGAAPDLDLLNPRYGLAIPDPQTYLANYTQTVSQLGFYAQDQIRVGERWIFTVGGRQDRITSQTDDRLAGTNRKNGESAFSGRVGVNYLLGNGWAPYVSYSESFLPTAGLDMDGKPFKSSRGKQVEAGIKYQPEGARTLFTMAVFELAKTNVVTYDPVTGDGRQIGKQRARGVEFEAKAELMRGLSATASLTVMDIKVLQSADSSEIGKAPPVIPRHTGSLWLDYAAGNGLGLGLGVNYTGKRENDEANTSKEGGFSLFNALLRYDQGAWRFALNAGNLFNKKYNTICYHGECYLGRERTLTATAKYRF